MEDSTFRARRYRSRAREIRTIAEDVRGSNERRKLIAAAKEFEDLAEELDHQTLK